MRVAPGCQASRARGSAALRIAAAELEAAASFVNASPSLLQGVGSRWKDRAEYVDEACEEKERNCKEESQKEAAEENTLYSERRLL